MNFERLGQQLNQQRTNDLYRVRTAVNGGNQRQLTSGEKSFLNFSSNDYLGLACDEQVKLGAIDAVNKYGAGCGGSPLVTGHSRLAKYLEDLIKDLTGQSGVMLYTSGFAANSGVISSLLTKDDYLVQDKLNHASLMNAGSDSAVKMQRFAHNDMASLAKQLQSKTSINASDRLVVTEGVFSMDGDGAPLAEISQLCRNHHAWLMVDDAHGFGINGGGAGSCAQANITPDILMATFGKAIGTSGAFVAADKEVIDYLVNFCRHYIYSTSLSPMIIGATMTSIELAQQPCRHQKLAELIGYFRDRASQLGLAIMPSSSAIQPLIIGDSHRAIAIANRLKEQGIWLTAIRPPTVAVGSARLRITLSTNHQESDIDRLLTALAEAVNDTQSSDYNDR
ncbi:MAG: 8-amino-7-oxononanoate synthase [Gammaproteobacteria bacterium]|nr:8-amino-7-oxononanoate synthase [Gammaproteobacteria bacterium]